MFLSRNNVKGSDLLQLETWASFARTGHLFYDLRLYIVVKEVSLGPKKVALLCKSPGNKCSSEIFAIFYELYLFCGSNHF